MLAQAVRYASWGENVAIKLPTVKAALPVIEELAARGIAVCTTLNFSVSQALAAGDAYERGVERAKAAGIAVRPCFVVQQGGRLDEYLLETAEDNGIDIRQEDVMSAGNAVCKKAYRLFRERGVSAKIDARRVAWAPPSLCLGRRRHGVVAAGPGPEARYRGGPGEGREDR